MRHVRLALVAAVSLVCLTRCDEKRSVSPTPYARSLLALARDARESSPEEEAWAATELGRIAGRAQLASARNAVNDVNDPNGRLIAALNEVVFGELGFVREVQETSLRFVLLPSVLRNRRGSCVGLGTLYLALGDMLGVPMEGVLRPGHFFVRTREKVSGRNIELLRKGEEMPDSWYLERFPILTPSGRQFGRGLSLSEVRAVVEYDVGNERRRQGRIPEARDAYEQSTRDFPDFAEAHASLGAMQHILGALNEAETSYRAARRANPALPGLDGNIDLLERERAADR